MHLIVLIWIAIHTPCFLVLVIDIFLNICLDYHSLADHLKALKSEQGETDNDKYLRLVFVIEEFQDLQCVINDLNTVLSVYIPPFITITIHTSGYFVANLVDSESFLEALSFISFPLWMFCYISTFCVLGEIVRDSVGVLLENPQEYISYKAMIQFKAHKVTEAVYFCCWYSSPIGLQKLLLMFLTECQRETIINVKPFFVLNFKLMTKVNHWLLLPMFNNQCYLSSVCSMYIRNSGLNIEDVLKILKEKCVTTFA